MPSHDHVMIIKYVKRGYGVREIMRMFGLSPAELQSHLEEEGRSTAPPPPNVKN